MYRQVLGELNNTYCNHCIYGHGNLTCDCGHTHSEHLSMSGCGVIKSVVNDGSKNGLKTFCSCTRYSQTYLRQLGETDKEFRARTGYVAG